VLEDTFTSTFTGAGNASQNPGQFDAGQLTIPQSGVQTFIVEAFYTSGSIEYMGSTGAFTATVNVSPGQFPYSIDSHSGWDGNLVFVPEPSTIALGGLGAAVLLLFRRRSRERVGP
jgi:PEP-CTERM motif